MHPKDHDQEPTETPFPEIIEEFFHLIFDQSQALSKDMVRLLIQNYLKYLFWVAQEHGEKPPWTIANTNILIARIDHIKSILPSDGQSLTVCTQIIEDIKASNKMLLDYYANFGEDARNELSNFVQRLHDMSQANLARFTSGFSIPPRISTGNSAYERDTINSNTIFSRSQLALDQKQEKKDLINQYVYLSRDQEKLKQYQQAIESLTFAINTYQSIPSTFMNKNDYEKIHSYQFDLAELYRELGLTLSEINFIQASDAYHQAIRVYPNPSGVKAQRQANKYLASYYNHLAYLYEKEAGSQSKHKNFDAAIELTTKALKFSDITRDLCPKHDTRRQHIIFTFCKCVYYYLPELLKENNFVISLTLCMDAIKKFGAIKHLYTVDDDIKVFELLLQNVNDILILMINQKTALSDMLSVFESTTIPTTQFNNSNLPIDNIFHDYQVQRLNILCDYYTDLYSNKQFGPAEAVARIYYTEMKKLQAFKSAELHEENVAQCIFVIRDCLDQQSLALLPAKNWLQMVKLLCEAINIANTELSPKLLSTTMLKSQEDYIRAMEFYFLQAITILPFKTDPDEAQKQYTETFALLADMDIPDTKELIAHKFNKAKEQFRRSRQP